MRINPSRRFQDQLCPHDFCLNNCAECDEVPKPRKSKHCFNPSLRYQTNGICKELPYLYPGALVITKAKWIGDAYYIEVIRKYHVSKRIHGISW